jgi:cellulose 1,4-beta-cellobiosidase
VSGLDLMAFFNDAAGRGSLETSWYLIDIEMGFEVWTGGEGLGISNFSASATATAQ